MDYVVSGFVYMSKSVLSVLSKFGWENLNWPLSPSVQFVVLLSVSDMGRINLKSNALH